MEAKLTFDEMADRMNAKKVSARPFTAPVIRRHYYSVLRPAYEKDPSNKTAISENVAKPGSMRGRILDDKEIQLFRSLLHYSQLGGLNIEEQLTYEEIARRMAAEGVSKDNFKGDRVGVYYRQVLRPVYEMDPAYENLRIELGKKVDPEAAKRQLRRQLRRQGVQKKPKGPRKLPKCYQRSSLMMKQSHL